MNKEPQNGMECSEFEALLADALDNALAAETRQEFETWAKSYAGANADQGDAQRRVTAAQNKFQKAKTAKAKQAAQQELQRAQQDYTQATAQLNAVPATIQAALGLKR